METQPTTMEKPKMSPRFFFISLGLLVTLITSVVSVLNLIFETLDKKFPDVLNSSYTYGYSTYDYNGIRTALATLIIFFPVFIVVSYFWKKIDSKGLGKIDEILKKWMIYIILFLSSLVIVIDLVTLVRYFVSGEITTRFVLKVLSALFVAFVVGFYYVLILRHKGSKKINSLFASVGALFVLFSIIWSFSIIGSPKEQRNLRLDDRRVSDLQNIQWQVISYWQQKEQLPESLSDLNNPISGVSLPVDPEFESLRSYEYAKIADGNNVSFELCATFSLPMPKGWSEYKGNGIYPVSYDREMAVSTTPAFGGVNDSWDHEEGRTCFTRTIDPDIYPPFEKR